ncbi:MAG: hypothetical protein R3B97_06865 [Dehalococcoidia bacterium]|nr:hypothetical protein [Dehalococcoidia bacterium]MCB9485624.1 hypothetical protein [Thermoflexaceae bacterium]
MSRDYYVDPARLLNPGPTTAGSLTIGVPDTAIEECDVMVKDHVSGFALAFNHAAALTIRDWLIVRYGLPSPPQGERGRW